MQRSGPWTCGTKFNKRAPRLNDLTFKIFKKKRGVWGGGGAAPRAVGRLLIGGGGGHFYSRVGKKGEGSYTHANGKK